MDDLLTISQKALEQKNGPELLPYLLDFLPRISLVEMPNTLIKVTGKQNFIELIGHVEKK